MGNYVVSARKYRPDTFASVVGQGHVTQTLKSAILTDQLAHAFLFSGPRGVGKTTCARILAKAINCTSLTNEGEPCNTCDACRSFNEGKSIVIHELDAASNNSVDDIRNLIEQTRYVPANGRRSVYIIDEVHMLSQAAFNAFLKTLEEPPAHVLFILATTEKHKILPTILSRCQKFDFRRIRVSDIAQHLAHIAEQEGIEAEFAALQQIALKADGALRDGLSLFDQLASTTDGPLTFAQVLENLNILDYDYYFRAIDLVQAGDHSGLLLLLDEIIAKGFEAKDVIVGLTEHIRNLLVCQDPQTLKLLETSDQVRTRYGTQSQQLSASFLLNAFHHCSEAEQKSRHASHPRLVVELVLIKLAHLDTAIRTAQLVTQEERQVEKKKSLTQGDTLTSPPKAEPQTFAQEAPAHNEPQAEPPAAESEPSPPVVPATRRRRSSSGPKLTGDFTQMRSQIEVKIAEEAANNPQQEEVVSYDINPAVTIDQDVFRKFLLQYATKVKEQNRIQLASILENGISSFEHNAWTFTVENDLMLSLLEKEQDILPFLRHKLGVPDMYWNLIVDRKYENPQDKIPYTNEEKLKEMVLKNPNLGQLQEIFKTRIIY
jgi:DNA polymerase-3 subunit gamma/tau